MESPEKNSNQPTGGEQKINEYINRIKAGESQEEITQGLPPSFKDAIEKGLSNQEATTEDVESLKEVASPGLAIIPPQYEGMDSETLDFIWTVPEYVDPEKTKTELERKAKALEHLREQENAEMGVKEKKFEEKIQIEKLRQELGAPESSEKPIDPKIEELNSRLEKYQVSLPNIDSIIASEGGRLSVVINGKEIEFDKFEIVIDPATQQNRRASIGFIEKKNKTEDKGIGLPIYLELGKQLAEKGITLEASAIQYGQGQSIWMNLAKLGFAKKVGGHLEFSAGIETGSEAGEQKDPFQHREVEHSFGDHEQATGMYNTLMDMGKGAMEGFKEDAIRKIEQYTNEIKAGKDKEYVLSGAPEAWRKEVERRLASEEGTKIDTAKEVLKNFRELSNSEIETFLNTLPKVPVAEGSRMTVIDQSLLKSKNYVSLQEGEEIYIHDGKEGKIGKILSKGAGSTVTIQYQDGSTFPLQPAFANYLYSLNDIKSVYEKK